MCVGVCHQKSTVAHLVVFKPGLWRQTGDREESSALQFRKFPTEHLRLTNRVCVPILSLFRWDALFVFV